MGITLDRAAKPLILVVDDEPAFLNQTKDCLESNGYEVVVARNGREAISIVDKEDIKLILLDIIMPVLNGVEVTKILKRNPLTRDIPIIVVSTMTEYKDRVEFFKIGANDYMPKPIDNGELMARVELQLQVLRLRSEVESANESLKQKNRMLEQHLSRIEHDLSVARSVQRALLPDANKRFGNLGIHFQHTSCENLGSDFIDYVEDDRGTIHILLADVSGHGIPSALLAAQLKVLFITIAQTHLSPAETVSEINRLASRVLIEGYYFTAIYMQYKPDTGVLHVVNAGHTPLLIFEKSTGKLKQVESSNAPVGFFAGEKYREVQIRPQPGDVVLGYTDGITEHTNATNDMFEVSGVINVFRNAANSAARDLVDTLLRKAREFGSSPVFSDDVTVAVFSFSETGTSKEEAGKDELEIESIKPIDSD